MHVLVVFGNGGGLLFHSCESIFIIFASFYVNSSRQNHFQCCNLYDLIVFSLIMES